MNNQDAEILKIIKEFSEKLPHFPDGRINYSNSDIAPVVTCFLKDKDKILLLKRSDKVRTYKGKWNTVAGYLDEPKTIREKALEKHKTWITCPVLIELKNKPEIKLDWEHTEYKWINPEELISFDIVPKLDKSLRRVLKK
jgi:isopentenyldiphosphate isomerase